MEFIHKGFTDFGMHLKHENGVHDWSVKYQVECKTIETTVSQFLN